METRGKDVDPRVVSTGWMILYTLAEIVQMNIVITGTYIFQKYVYIFTKVHNYTQ